MHEFSLAQNILEIAEEAVEKNKAVRVVVLNLEIGSLASVEIPALETALEIIQKDTVLENSKINIVIISAKAVCNTCHIEFEPKDIIAPCPSCENFGMKILCGKELIVKSIEIE
jgi:hydrogenase nickel incorporation protein HypA/HybF